MRASRSGSGLTDCGVLAGPAGAVAELVLTVEPQDAVVLPGRAVLLDCEAEARSEVNINTQPSISWRGADGQLLTFFGDSYRYAQLAVRLNFIFDHGGILVTFPFAKLPTNRPTFARSQLANGSLYISAFGEEDGGLATTAEYQCLASLETVGSLVSRTARLQLASKSRTGRGRKTLTYTWLSRS